MSRAKGTFMTIDRWVAELAPKLPGSAGWVLMELSYQSNYDEKGLTVPELMQRLGKGQRTIEEAVGHLAAQGHAIYDAQTRAYFCAGVAQDLAQALRRNLRQKWAKKSGLDDKCQTDYSWISDVKRKREGKEESKAGQRGEVATQQPRPARPEHHDGRAAEPILTSQGKNPVDVGGNLVATVLPPSPGSAAPPSPAASSTALGLFMDLFASHAEGQRFCTHNAGQLDRWAADYTQEFVRLAWRLAPTVPGVNRPQHALAWLLNREREWPAELRRQYRDDLRAAGQGSSDEAAPAVGEVRVLTDGSGRSGRVLEVYLDTRTLRLQIGLDETEAIDTPWSVTAPSVRASDFRSVI